MSGKDLDSAIAMRVALRNNSNDLLAYFERRVQPIDGAADLLSETMLQSWRSVSKLPDSAEEQRMWLFGVASKVLMNNRRSLRRRSALVARIGQTLRSDDRTEDVTEALAVQDAVGRLPLDQRDLVRLVHWDGFTLAEAARILGLNASTARGRYASAKSLLREALAEECSA